MIVEEAGARFLFDPGNFTEDKSGDASGIDAVIITHEHQDHFHLPSIRTVLEKNPSAQVIGNAAVQQLLAKEGIESAVVGDGGSTSVKDVLIEGFGKDHATIYQQMGLVENTSYLVNSKFYFPGDAFHAPGKPVEVLALPVAGPWMKMSEAIDFAKAVRPRVAFGVHDAMIQPFFRGFIGNALKMFAPETEYASIPDGETKEWSA
jgi:L-ascorbate metabolism protein UlaG (beta-lactamase superfamily)